MRAERVDADGEAYTVPQVDFDRLEGLFDKIEGILAGEVRYRGDPQTVMAQYSWSFAVLYLQGAMVPRGLFKFIVQLSFGRVGASLFKELVNNAKQAEAGALGIASHHRSHVFIHSRFVFLRCPKPGDSGHRFQGRRHIVLMCDQK